MIQELLAKGKYKFNGTLKDFKKCLSSLKSPTLLEMNMLVILICICAMDFLDIIVNNIRYPLIKP